MFLIFLGFDLLFPWRPSQKLGKLKKGWNCSVSCWGVLRWSFGGKKKINFLIFCFSSFLAPGRQNFLVLTWNADSAVNFLPEDRFWGENSAIQVPKCPKIKNAKKSTSNFGVFLLLFLQNFGLESSGRSVGEISTKWHPPKSFMVTSYDQKTKMLTSIQLTSF